MESAAHSIVDDAARTRALPEVGEVIAGRYRIERALARGGMGALFVAEHLGLARSIALKFVIAETPEGAARLLREARAAARLSGEHVVRVLDVGTHGETAFLAMELLAGVDLHAHLCKHGPLSVAEAVGHVLQACEGLAEAHAHGIVHRDLKPSNLFLAVRSDGASIVKLLDFGIAKAPCSQAWSTDHLTSVVALLGSPPYMSPEQLRDAASVDARTDLWSLGVILHELLTRRHPFEATSSMQLGARIALGAPTPLRAHFPEAPVALEAVVARCLEKDLAARFQSVAELAAALAPFASERARASIGRIERASIGEAATAAAARRPSARPQRAIASTQEPARAPSAPSVSVTRVQPPEPSVERARHSVVVSRAVSPTERFRRQHEELQELGLAIASKLSRKTIAAEAATVRRLVAQFAGKLSVHASMENEALYPRLMSHDDPAVRARAIELFDEVGTIYQTFGVYAKRWPTTASIEADPAGFKHDTAEVLRVLAMRMMREND